MAPRFIILLISLLIFLAGENVSNAYAHGIGTSLTARNVRVSDETFSDNTVRNGDELVINGVISNVEHQKLAGSIRLYVTPTKGHLQDGTAIEIPWYYGYLSATYPPFRDQSAMYFRIESTPNTLVLEPGDEKPYEIKVYPLKAGSYHIHTYVTTELGSKLGRGQSVTVEGESAYTNGEILLLLLPMTLFLAAIAAMLAALSKRARLHGWKITSLRLFFVFKSAYETMLLSGVVLVLLLTPNLPQYLLASVGGLAVAMGALTVGSYLSACAISRQRIIAIGTLGATSMFYFALMMSGCTYANSQCYPFNLDGPFVFLIAIGNALAAGLISIMTAGEHKRLGFS